MHRIKWRFLLNVCISKQVYVPPHYPPSSLWLWLWFFLGLYCIGQAFSETSTDAICCHYTEEFDKIAVGFTDGMIRLFKTANGEITDTLSDEETQTHSAPVTGIKHRPVSKIYPISDCITCTCNSKFPSYSLIPIPIHFPLAQMPAAVWNAGIIVLVNVSTP